jgi:hypothetical protein
MSEPSFCRYTTLPILIDILSNKRLTLLDPKKWDDKNDSFFIELYKKRRNLKSVLALCFANSPETYHHWKVFAGNESGVRIIFSKKRLLACFKDECFLKNYVEYPYIKDLGNTHRHYQKLPFLKRHAFSDENEYRIIYQDEKRELSSLDVSIPINSILKIYINPWMPKSVYSSVKKVIKNIEGCSRISIIQTTIVENEKWKRLGQEIRMDIENVHE